MIKFNIAVALTQTKSAAIHCLQAGEGVISDLPWEHGQLPKGIQEGNTASFVEESCVEPDPCSVMAAVAVVGIEADDVEPLYDEACQQSDWPKWKEAIDVELGNLKATGTWEVVERPHGTNIVDSKWVFRLKKDAKGEIIKWKARLVA